MGFVLRNLENLSRALAEMYRVLRGGGWLVCLEVARPQPTALFHRLYLAAAVPWMGWWVSRNLPAYSFLARSARLVPKPEEVTAAMKAAGFQEIKFRRLSHGAVGVHLALKSGG